MTRFHYMTMLRDPFRRLVSAFYHSKRRKVECPTLARGASLLDFARCRNETGPRGCATKMLVGRACEAAPYPSAAEVEQAKARLAEFSFVGLSDDWTASVCRAHSLFGRPTYEAATGNVRPGQYDHSAQAGEASKLAADSLSGGFYDWADARLFAFAVERFGGSPLPPALAHGLALAKMDPGRTGSRA
mmetsp:Transcript_6912/g.21805  ORF Transcript_6912/g.21805 Transcript_6912/m.21805 type:complete len:188 (+) Transcript_6912:989-1552(+)